MVALFREYIMKKYIIVSLILFHSMRCYTNNQELFFQANQAYLSGDHQAAIELYESMGNKGPAVWYNMGNCYFALQDRLQAQIFWSKAYACGNHSIMKLAQFNLEQLAQSSESQSISDWLYDMSAQYSLMFWQLLFIIVWMALIYALCIMRRLLLSSIPVVLVLVFSVILMVKYTVATRDIGIICRESPVYIGPNEHLHQRSTISAGCQVAVVQALDSWYKIQHGSLVGWIPALAMKRIKELS
jgi:hypothetical protein